MKQEKHGLESRGVYQMGVRVARTRLQRVTSAGYGKESGLCSKYDKMPSGSSGIRRR